MSFNTWSMLVIVPGTEKTRLGHVHLLDFNPGINFAGDAVGLLLNPSSL